MLKSAGMVPAWIDDDRAIRAEKHGLATMLEDLAGWFRAALTAQVDAPEPSQRGAELEDALSRFEARYRERAAALNARIQRHNLGVPSPTLHHLRVPVEAELARLRAELGT
jgi:hypothetical protein